MGTIDSRFRILAAAMLGAAPILASAASPAELRAQFEAAAREAEPAYAGLSASRGEQFFRSRHGSEWSCASCHTDNPLSAGRHAKTAKDIAPLAPAANPNRFTDAARVEKWLRRNCNDVLGRACTPREKGDVLAYLMSLK